MIDILLTIDFDAESPWLTQDGRVAGKDLTQLSWGAYGARRGIRRIAEVLEELDIFATFFVPGRTVDGHAEKVRWLFDHGHEIAHHGYDHIAPVTRSPAEQREDLMRGIDAIENCTGIRPVGYRSPCWQLTPETLALLVDEGFSYDSSCMGDDRPYFESHAGKEILELPVHWLLDDFPHIGWTSQGGGPLRRPEDMFAAWQREVDLAVEEERTLVLTCHPEVSGRPSASAALREMLTTLGSDPRTRFCRCSDAIASIQSRLSAPTRAKGNAATQGPGASV